MSDLKYLLSGQIRHNWTLTEIEHIFQLPFNDLLFTAQSLHRKHFNPNQVQTSTLLSIKTGACPEDCAYCPQSVRYDTGLSREQLMAVEEVVEQAKVAKQNGATRFCMGAAWRSPREKDFAVVLTMVESVKALGMETCVTLGMLNSEQAQRLKEAGLDYYNHNLDSSQEYYKKIITTRSYQDRLTTLNHVREAGINVCAGGIIGMGESIQDRYGLLMELSNQSQHPESVPINMLVAVEGTPLAETPKLDPFEFVRTIATARIMMPKSYVRLSAGREEMNEQTQALCFFAGANSIFYGDKLLTTPNPESDSDQQLFNKLGIQAEATPLSSDELAPLSPKPEPKTEKPLYYNAAEMN